MQQQNIIDQKDTLSDLPVGGRLKDILTTITTWAKIIAIINFVSIPLGFYESIKENSVVSGIITAGVTILINIFLLNFSNKTKRSIDTTDQYSFNSGMNDLKNYFKVIGIVLIIMIVIAVVALLWIVNYSNKSAF